MSLLDDFTTAFYIMNKTRVSDGEGGFSTTWEEGALVKLAVAHTSTIEAQIAEKESTASTYTFLHDKSLAFDYHDVLKRKSDGAIFRVTQESQEDVTPSGSSLNLSKILAEKWELTT